MLALAEHDLATPQVPEQARMPYAVSIDGISKSFGRTSVLQSVSLDIKRGEFFSLLGPSGCGKTTLLRIIGGFETPSAGELRIDGRDVIGEPSYRRRTNMVFQHGALFPHLTVAGNVAFGLEMSGVGRKAIEQRVEEALEMVRLGGYGTRQVDQLSGGQRQRVALARALINRPQVLLLDEPLSALDLQLRLQMQDELRRLQRETASTFVFVTHDQGEAIAMSDRIAVMHEGRILQVGTPREVYETPVRKFVAMFMGRSNFLHGRIEEIRNDCSGVVMVEGLPITCTLTNDLAVGEEVMIALRYEKVDITPVSAGVDGLVAIIEEEIYLGASVRRRVRVADKFVLVADSANTGDNTSIPIGTPVCIRWSNDALRVLRE